MVQNKVSKQGLMPDLGVSNTFKMFRLEPRSYRVLSEKLKVNENDKKKVIIHELLHIPINFSGSLLAHKYGHKE